MIFSVAVSIVGLVLGLASGFGGRGQGMGGMGGPFERYFWLVLIVAPLIVAVAVLGYAMLFPDISKKKPEANSSTVTTVEKEESTLNAVLQVLKDDERKVIETLVAEGGTMLQKDIRWKTGFSRVKTHRILYRLAERGIVTAEKHYNTNKITLADWLVKAKSQD
jgi:uncharacterized membrane protein